MHWACPCVTWPLLGQSRAGSEPGEVCAPSSSAPRALPLSSYAPSQFPLHSSPTKNAFSGILLSAISSSISNEFLYSMTLSKGCMYVIWEHLKKIALSRSNLHITQLTHLKCKWFLVCSQSCATITTIGFRTFSTQKEPLWLFVVTPHSPHSSPASHQPAPGNDLSTFCLYIFVYSGHFTLMQSYETWSFVIGFFHLVSCFQVSFIL